MKIESILECINIEEIFNTIVDLEGPKYPLNNMVELNLACDYIVNKLTSYGIRTEVQEFYVKGFDEPFKNVIGWIGDFTKPAIVLGSHYDTVENSPGANDNLSAVAVSLEAARILSMMENPPTTIIAVFTLEEEHPGLYKAIKDKLHSLGIMDKNHRFTSAKMFNFAKKISRLSYKRRQADKPIYEVFQDIFDELKDKLDHDELALIQTYIDEFKEFFPDSLNYQSLYIVGSAKFVEKVQSENIQISNIINFDCIGWINNHKYTQKPLPLSEQILPYLSLYKTNLNDSVGNFIGIMGEINSKPMLDEFVKHCGNEGVDIPHLGLYLPFLKTSEIVIDRLKGSIHP